MRYTPIGKIHTPYQLGDEMPRQASESEAEGVVEVYPEYSEGLQDLEGFSHIILLYLFDRIEGYDLLVQTPWSEKKKGLFSTRAPRRPNPIGLSVVELLKIDGNRLRIRGVDMLDKTPLLDIKPYVPEIDTRSEVKKGWMQERFG